MKVEDITNRIVSASASLIAIAALSTAVYQAKLSRDQAKITVWPYLLQGNAGNNGYARIVHNLGQGPAIIRAFEVLVDSQAATDWTDVAKRLGAKLTWKDSKSTSFGPGLVVPPGTVIGLVTLDTIDEKIFRAKIDGHLETRVCYCSLYGDCWQANSEQREPTPVDRCVDNPKHRFRE